MKRKGLTTVIAELKHRIPAKAAKNLNTSKGSNITGSLIDCAKWIKRKFTISSVNKQGVVTGT